MSNPWSIPDSWRWTTIGEIADVVGGGTPRTDNPEFFGGKIPWITPADLSGYTSKTISHGARNITQLGLDNSGARMMPAGTILFSSRAPIGYVAIAANSVSTNQGFKSFVPREGIVPDFVYYYLQSAKELILNFASGTTFLEISGKKAAHIPIPVAPIQEQECIVKEIEKQFTRLEAGVSAMKRMQTNLKHYRAAVLKAACEGCLVPTEAELARKEGCIYEPADVLMKRNIKEAIHKNRRNDIQKDKHHHDHEPPNAKDLPQLPEGWTWAAPKNLALSDKNAICAGPFGTIFKAKDFRSKGVPIIFLRHVAPGKYLTRKPGFMDTEKWNELFKPYSVYGGELLITKLGDPPGVCAIYPQDIGPAMVTPDVIKMSVNEKLASPKFLMCYFNSETSRHYATGVAYGTTRLRLTIPIFRDLPVPLPPIAEQHRIVAEVERRLSVIDELESVVTANLKRAERLRQALLHKAFTGQLA
jgi:type I restriction enzyme S subunit